MPATAFITLEDIKSWKDPGGSIADTSEDTMIELAIGAVCTDMEEYLHRPVIARELVKVSDGGCTRIMLAHRSPGHLSVASVDEDGVTLTADTDYKVYSGPGYIARVSDGAFSKFIEKPQAVTVTYTAGVAQTVDGVPKNLKLAAMIAVRFYLGLGPENWGKRFEGQSVITSDAFPKQVRWILDHYRLRNGGAT